MAKKYFCNRENGLHVGSKKFNFGDEVPAGLIGENAAEMMVNTKALVRTVPQPSEMDSGLAEVMAEGNNNV